MRCIALLLLVLFARCGSGRGASVSAPPGPPPGILTTSTSVEVRLDPEEHVIADLVTMSRDSAWVAVLVVYRTLGVPVERSHQKDGVITSAPFRAPRQLLGRRLAAFIDCGAGLTGARVEQWDVTAQIVTGVEAAGAGARVASRFTGTARPRDGSSTPPITCTSTGVLEKEIVRLVQERKVR